MMVECIGLPGVGKTTSLQSGAEALAAAFKIVDSSTSHTLNSLISLAFFHMWLRWVVGDLKLARKLAYRMSFRLLNIFSARPVLFFDAGVAQVILENLIETDFEDADRKIEFLKKIRPRLDVLIYVHDDMEDVLARESGRQSPRFDMEAGELRIRYGKAVNLIEKRLLPCARRVYKVKSNSPFDIQEILAR